MSHDIDEIRHERELLILATRRLYELDKQAVILGITVDPKIVLEQQNLRTEIAGYKQRLIELIAQRLATTTDLDECERLRLERERYKQAQEPEPETETDMTTVSVPQTRQQIDGLAERVRVVEQEQRSVRGVLAQVRVDVARFSVAQRWIIGLLLAVVLGLGVNLWLVAQLYIQLATR